MNTSGGDEGMNKGLGSVVPAVRKARNLEAIGCIREFNWVSPALRLLTSAQSP